MTINLTAVGLVAAASTDARTITGRIVRYNVPSDDGRRMTIHAGAITPRQPLKRVKMLTDHDMGQPVGYMTALAEADDYAQATFAIPAGEAGDKALADAENGLRDGLSVGLTLADDADAFDFDNDGNLHIYAAALHEVSLCAIPAYSDAQVTDVAAMAAHRKESTMKLTAAQLAALTATLGHAPSDAEIDTEADRIAAAAPASTAGEANTSTDAAAAPAAPADPAPLTAGHRQAPAPAYTTNRPASLADVAATVSGAIRAGNPGGIMAALSDVVPSADAGEGYLRDSWIGQLWTATKTGRPWIESFGTPKQLTSMKIKGYRWATRPKPAKYDGDKAEVPSNKPKTEPAEADAERWAGGWDIDRIFIDLGDPSFLTDFWNAAMLEYQQDSDADVAAKIIAAATSKAAADTVLGAVSGLASDLRKIGASLDVVRLSDDLFDQYAALKQSEVPFWLANAVGGVNLKDAEATASNISITAAPELPDGTVLGYDTRAATVSEKSPIQIKAFDVAHGGVDLGFFSYGGVLVNDKRAIVKRKVTPADDGGGEA